MKNKTLMASSEENSGDKKEPENAGKRKRVSKRSSEPVQEQSGRPSRDTEERDARDYSRDSDSQPSDSRSFGERRPPSDRSGGRFRSNRQGSGGTVPGGGSKSRPGRRSSESLREQMAAAGEPWHDRYREVPENEIPIEQLRKMDLDQLISAAAEEKAEISPKAGKREIIHAIVRNRVTSQGFAWGGGALEILRDGFGFLRHVENNFEASPTDVYVSPSQIRRFSLEQGATVYGQVRAPKTGEGFPALLRVEMVDEMGPMESTQLTTFEDLVPSHPNRSIDLHLDPVTAGPRIVDLLAPAGFGQRGLIVSPPRAGKTLLLQSLARAVITNHPEAWVTMLLVDERPEEVTEMHRVLSGPRCEVVASTFDQPAQAHIRLSELVLAKSRRLVEAGVDVVIFLDSLTRLSRAWNSMQTASSKIMSGGLDSNALERPKAFFGSARETEQGGSLTIFATALVETGSRMDDVIFEEFKGTGNMEIVLSRDLADHRIWPAIDISRSGTRREEAMMNEGRLLAITRLRQSLLEMNDRDAIQWLTREVAKHPTNEAFLHAFYKSTQSG